MIPRAKVIPNLTIQYFFQDQKDAYHEHYTHTILVSLEGIGFSY